MAWWKNGGMPNETLASYAEAVAAGLPFLDETSTTTTTTTPASVSITEISIKQYLEDKVACGHYTEVRKSIFGKKTTISKQKSVSPIAHLWYLWLLRCFFKSIQNQVVGKY